MQWYHYVSCFAAGFFLTNFVPHFIHGISGNPFPTPFARPPGKGLSTPLINVLWALFNLVVGYLLFRAGKVFSGDIFSVILFFAGLAGMSVFGAIRFADKEKA